jgi:ATP-binding cassette, subfamily B, bacterial MsbA
MQIKTKPLIPYSVPLRSKWERNFLKSMQKIFKSLGIWKDYYLLLREVKYFPRIAILALGFSLIAAAFEGFGIGFLLGFLQNLMNPNAQAFQIGLDWFDHWILGVHEPSNIRLYRVSALILVVTWLRAGFNYLTHIYMELMRIKLVDRLNKRIFNQLQSLSLSFYNKTNSGEIINTITTEVSRVQQILQLGSFIISKSLVLLVYIIVATRISWQLTLISVLLFSLLGVGLSKLNRWIRESSFPISKANSKFTETAIEFVNGIRTVHAFSTQAYEQKKLFLASANVMKESHRSALFWSIVRPLSEGLATTVLVGMIILGITVFAANGTIQAASLLTFLFVLFRLIPAIHEISGNLARINHFTGSIYNIEKLLAKDGKPYLKNGQLQFRGLSRSIAFVSVDFSYDSSTSVLKNITLTIPKGQTLALVGASGSGKSTLADLIPRFYDPIQGAIYVDGIDLREFDIHSIRQKMAIVSQDTFIFNTSVRQNIAYGLDWIDDGAIIEAAALANAIDFILQLPDGFETKLGDRGVRLSGGQRQRIAIARALLHNPEILILDEATSALDSISERLIQQSLDKLSAGRTVISIAHRLSTIARADKVVVLEQGQIVEQGGYQELLDQQGKLWKYYQIQNGLTNLN